MIGSRGLIELVGRQALPGPDVKVLWKSDGALDVAYGELG